MSKEQLFIFDTTLRDGAQTQGVDFSVDDKIRDELFDKGVLIEDKDGKTSWKIK